jgi:hypothetical protein
MMLALIVGISSTALAGTGAGGVFNIGVSNTVNAWTYLYGSVNNPLLILSNTNAGASATNLELRGREQTSLP